MTEFKTPSGMELLGILKDRIIHEEMVQKIQEETDILATDEAMGLITTFFEANKVSGVEVSKYRKVLASYEEPGNELISIEKFYMAICIKYPANDIGVSALLINLAATHHGLNNMLIDYLHRLKVTPITVTYNFTKPVTNAEIEENFLTKVAPKLVAAKRKESPVKIEYVSADHYSKPFIRGV